MVSISILTDNDKFYANESVYREKGLSKFEEYLIKNDIKHIVARVNHPQTNGKLERVYGEIERKIHLFNSIDEFVDWYNNKHIWL